MRLPSREEQDEKPCPREDGEAQLPKRGQVQDLPLLTAKNLNIEYDEQFRTMSYIIRGGHTHERERNNGL